MSLSKPEGDNALQKALKAYVRMLQQRPVFTKSCTSAFTGALGNLISQIVVSSPKSVRELNLRSIGAYAAAGFLFIGPSVHHFHSWMEHNIPKTEAHMALKRLMLDRLFFSPSFLFVLLYLLAILEGQPHEVAMKRLKETYWLALSMNWKVWTPLQYINVRFIPQMYRAPFMSFMSLVWTVYISVKRAR